MLASCHGPRMLADWRMRSCLMTTKSTEGVILMGAREAESKVRRGLLFIRKKIERRKSQRPSLLDGVELQHGGRGKGVKRTFFSSRLTVRVGKGPPHETPNTAKTHTFKIPIIHKQKENPQIKYYK